MRVCVLSTQLDSFKGGNHLPLFGAMDGVTFVIVTGSAKLDGALPKNVEVQSLNMPRRSYYYGKADRAFGDELMRRHPPKDDYWKQFDVIHLNQTLHPRLLELEASGRPVLYAVHHPVTADREVAVAESRLLGKFIWKMRYKKLIAWQKILCRNARHILTVSETVKTRLVRDYACNQESIHVVHNGVDGDEFTPSPDETVADVVAVGSFLHPRKGFRYLLEVYRMLAEKKIRIADVGRRSREQTILLKGIPGLTAYGTVPHEQLVDVMRKSSVLISTALYEGFGLSLIEALACGHPAFAFDGGAVREVLSPIDQQLIVPVRDTDELAKRVRAYLAQSPKDKQRRGEQYRTRVLELYSMRSAADALRGLYATLSAHARRF